MRSEADEQQPNNVIHNQLEPSKGQSSRGSLKWLLLYMLAVIVVCLTAFNFYLFCWIWSSLGGGGGGGQQSAALGVVGEKPRLNLISSWNEIQVEGRLSAESAVQVSELHNRADNALLRVSSPHSVQIIDASSRRKIAGDSGGVQSPLPLLVVANRQVHFPAGLQVSGSSDQVAGLPGRGQVSCDAAPKSECTLSAPTVRLTNQRGVDFDRKSVQTGLVETRRVHSATNLLGLLSPKSISLKSSSKMELTALDELLLFSRNSSVILESRLIDVGQLKVGPTRRGPARRNEANLYRLCICLASQIERTVASYWMKQESSIGFKNRTKSSKFGLVFAVKQPELSCQKVGDSFCNRKSLE